MQNRAPADVRGEPEPRPDWDNRRVPHRPDARFETPTGEPIAPHASLAHLLGGINGNHPELVAQILRQGLPHRTELGLDRDEDTAETSVG